MDAALVGAWSDKIAPYLKNQLLAISVQRLANGNGAVAAACGVRRAACCVLSYSMEGAWRAGLGAGVKGI